MVVENGVAEVEDDGFGDRAVSVVVVVVVVAVVVVGRTHVFGVIGGIGSRTHVVDEKMTRCNLNRKINKMPPCQILYIYLALSHLSPPSPPLFSSSISLSSRPASSVRFPCCIT